MVLPGNQSNMSLPIDCLLSLCFCRYEAAAELSQMLQRIVACSLNIVGHTLFYDDNIMSIREIEQKCLNLRAFEAPVNIIQIF